MRIVLDTHVFISAAKTPPATTAQVSDARQSYVYNFVLSPQIIDEIADVIQRPKIRSRQMTLRAADQEKNADKPRSNPWFSADPWH